MTSTTEPASPPSEQRSEPPQEGSGAQQSSGAQRARLRALAVLCAMQLMIILDGTVVTVALPTIQSDLGFSQAGLAWVMNSYLIAFAGLLLLAGRIGDLIGSKRVFLAGLALFTAASLLCGVATGAEVLIAGRFLQGVGGALASAVILGMIVGLFPAPGEQARAMGVYGFTSASGASIGLILGGVITQTVGWHWSFLINVPIGLVSLALAVRLLAPQRGLGLGKGADVLGAVLVTAGLSLGVYTIVQTAEPTVELPRTLLLAAAAVLLLAAFVLRQARAAQPLLSLHIFRKRQVTAANVVVVFLFAAGFGFQFMTALYLQRVLGFDSLQTGLAFLPAPLLGAVMSLFVAPRLTVRFGSRALLLAGLAAFLVALLVMSQAPADGSYLLNVAPVLALMGAGIGVGIPAAIMLAMSGAEPGDAGLASGLNNTAQQAGAAVGTAVLATLAASQSAVRVSEGVAEAAALRDGYSAAFVAAAGFVLAALVLTATLLRPSKK
ncbi:EmrB/QacA subfamily drug resistance transporter [Kribbella orskensis]|uniref:EmrB/QacA subfamily drug resistance transporter n=1 Tax=Kribbella orskensis TaxID=2512216 RepID=A0ABY2BGZ4_9ACTN|nr:MULTISPECIES: MFS transporter [Kribbella]TCN38377.1 EmrB/QacA subfamily drug resistance transporter [Kribbella sp. VKM Ac-2500]TCO20093.1 EmrB/QacA subfamily drug resistance transporter [Kribbella orskensis]